MSSTCNISSCKNDRRLRSKFLVMPHVIELKFHAPRPSEYLAWQGEMGRDDYVVGIHTRICSNHFKYGKPMEQNRTPSQYLKSYPDWATTSKEARANVAGAPDEIICQVVAHVCGYIQDSDADDIMRRCQIPRQQQQQQQQDSGSSGLHRAVLNMSKDQARKLVPIVISFVPPGKCLEAIAIFKHEISFPDVKRLCVTSSVSGGSSCDVSDTGQEMDTDVRHSAEIVKIFHAYHLDSNIKTERSDETCDTEPPLESTGSREESLYVCDREQCLHQQAHLKDKISHLEGQLAEQETKNSRLSDANVKLLAKIKSLEKVMATLRQNQKSINKSNIPVI